MAAIHWSKDARKRIAPTTLEDLSTHNFWMFDGWQDIRRTMSQPVHSADEEIAAAWGRIAEMEAAPKTLSPLEMGIVCALVGERLVFDYFARQFGTVTMATVLASPWLTAPWDDAAQARVAVRKTSAPDGLALRALILKHPSDRGACKVAVQPAWDAGDVLVHEQLAYAFFDDEAWRAQALAEVLEQAPPFTHEQLTLVRDADTMRTLLARRPKGFALSYPEIVASLGESALPILLELAKTAKGPKLHTSHTLAMTLFVTEEAATHLAGCISHPSTRDRIGKYFESHPDLARRVLPAASQGASRNAALAKGLMIKICGPSVAAGEDVASLDDPLVPSVLRDAPWKNPPRPLPKIPLDLDAYPSSIVIPEKQKATALLALATQRKAPDMNEDEARAYASAHVKETWMWRLVVDGKAVPLAVVLDFFVKGKWRPQITMAMLAQFGEAALPGLRHQNTIDNVDRDVIVGIDDPRIALTLATEMLEEGKPRWAWFAAHPRAAATGLLAAAHDGATRRVAEITLRRLANAGHADVIREVARNVSEIDAFLARDPRLDVFSVPKIPAVSVTRPRLRGGRALGDDVIERVLEMLALSPSDAPYVGIEDLKRACEPRSLAEMAWDLAALADGGGKHSRARQYPDWMRFSVVHLGDDEVIRRLTPALKHHTIYRVLETLAQRGVRSAAMELATAHERGDAPQSMARVAASSGMTEDELVETILPTTELDRDGTTTLQYGSRALRVGFDTTLAPTLSMGETRLASLPRAKKDDDAVVVKLARERWDELKEDVRTIAHLRSRALEDAMRTGRRIAAAHFVSAWATHPLGQHHARGMVWALEREGALVTFRVAEDGTFAGARDEALRIEDTDIVRVPHPAELSRDVLDDWLRIFSDYGLVQPVAQLGRTPMQATPEELAQNEIVRALPRPVLYAAASRILREQRASDRALTRCAGSAVIDTTTTWKDGKTQVTKLKLYFRADEKLIPAARIDPVEVAEALFVMRLLLEAS